MTEQEKAIDLVEEFYQYTNTNSREPAKSCATILAKEVLVKLKYYGAPQHAVEFWEETIKQIDRIPAFKQ